MVVVVVAFVVAAVVAAVVAVAAAAVAAVHGRERELEVGACCSCFLGARSGVFHGPRRGQAASRSSAREQRPKRGEEPDAAGAVAEQQHHGP